MGCDSFFEGDFLMEEELRLVAEDGARVRDSGECDWFYDLLVDAGQGRGSPEGGGTRPPPGSAG